MAGALAMTVRFCCLLSFLPFISLTPSFIGQCLMAIVLVATGIPYHRAHLGHDVQVIAMHCVAFGT